MKQTPETACKRAVELMGGARKVAAQFGITAQAVYKWDRVPAKSVLEIETALAGKVSRHELRPDIFGERA